METINSILGIIGFLFTLLNLFFTLQINKKLKRESNKQQFLKERHKYTEQLELYAKTINEEEVEYEEILRILRNIDKIMEQLLLYKIWEKDILDMLKSFIDTTINIAKEMQSYGFNTDLKRKHCYCASTIIEYETKKKSFITEKFRNDYCIQLNKIIAIIGTDSIIIQ